MPQSAVLVVLALLLITNLSGCNTQETRRIHEALEYIPIAESIFEQSRERIELLRYGVFNELKLECSQGLVLGIQDERLVGLSTVGLDLDSEIVRDWLPEEEIEALRFLFFSDELTDHILWIGGWYNDVNAEMYHVQNVYLMLFAYVGNPPQNKYTYVLDDNYLLDIEILPGG